MPKPVTSLFFVFVQPYAKRPLKHAWRCHGVSVYELAAKNSLRLVEAKMSTKLVDWNACTPDERKVYLAQAIEGRP